MANTPVWITKCVLLSPPALPPPFADRLPLRSDDAFKALLHTAPHGKREYYESIRLAIQKYRRTKDCPRFWLFSLRQGSSTFLLYPLPQTRLTDSLFPDRSVLMSWFDPSLK